MDHLLSYIAHVLVGYGIRRTLFHVPLGLVVLVAVAAAVFIARRSTARRSGFRGSRRYRP